MGQGKGARARQKAKREAYLANKPYFGFTCRGCKHEDVWHQMFVGYCILEGCDCSKMDEIKGEKMHDAKDPDCVCDSCMGEQIDRLDEQIALIKGESQKDNETVVLLTEGENK